MTEPVSVEALAAGLARRGTPLPAESGLFILLEAVEAMAARPVWLTPAGVRVGGDGMVSVDPALDLVSVPEALGSALDTLDAVLMPPPSGALSLAARVKSGEVDTVAVFASELEALLVPLNRGAARRMLGRLAREHARVALAPAAHAHDREVYDAHDRGVGALLATAEPASETPTRMDGTAATGRSTESAESAGVKGAGGATDTLPDGGSMRSWREDEDEDLRPARRRSQGTGMAALVLAVVAVLAAGVFLYHRLQRAEARASRHDGVARGAAAAVIASR